MPALVQFNRFAVLLGIASLAVVAVYPFAKRVTDWPQFVLGLAFSWGALMGWAAHFGALSLPPLLLYAGSILWVIGYDTIYAHQDKEDDALVGVRSTARLFGAATKRWLVGLYGGALALFVAAFLAAGVPLLAYAGLALAGAPHGLPDHSARHRRPRPMPEAVQVERRARLAGVPRPAGGRTVGHCRLVILTRRLKAIPD